MNAHALQQWLVLAGALHFCQIPAMAFFSTHVLRLQPELALLAPINRRVVQVLAIAVVVTVLGLGSVVVSTAAEIASSPNLGRALCAFLAAFWAFRAGCQVWYAAVWPRTRFGERAIHYLLLSLFVVQASIYGAVVLRL